MKEKVGMMMLAFGIMTADSEWLLVPIALLTAGVWLMKDLIARGSEDE